MIIRVRRKSYRVDDKADRMREYILHHVRILKFFMQKSTESTARRA